MNCIGRRTGSEPMPRGIAVAPAASHEVKLPVAAALVQRGIRTHPGSSEGSRVAQSHSEIRQLVDLFNHLRRQGQCARLHAV